MIQLDQIVFTDHAIPEEVTFGGEQRLIVHELVGGRRIVDAMGRQDLPIIWRGLLWGISAEDTAKSLDALRIEGRQLPLTFNGFAYTVVIRNLELRVLKPWMVEYRISCEVIHEGVDSAAPGQDAAIFGDWQGANDLFNSLTNNPLVSGIKDAWGTVTSAMTSVQAGIQQVASWQTAVQSQINAVLAPLQMARFSTLAIISQFNSVVAGIGTVGGILPGGQWLMQGATLLTQANAMMTLPTLHNFDNALGRLEFNLRNTATGSSAQTVTVGGGSLYQLAAQHYGDAAKWTLIARANGLTDPQLTGIQTLTIPPPSTGAGGVLQP